MPIEDQIQPRVLADGPLARAVLDLLADRVEIVPWSSTAMNGARAVDAIYTYGHPIVDADLLSRLTSLKVISNYGVGVDHIDLRAAAEHGIPVGNTPGILDGATADLAFALMLAAARRIVDGDRYARSSAFTHYDPGYMLGREVHGSTLGIVGLGRIGQQIAKRARAFDMRVLYNSRNRNQHAEASLDVHYLPFTDLLETSDFVVLSVPLTSETKGLMDRASLARLKSSAILVNVSRGAVVDTQALTEALQGNRIYAAALDVTDPEPLPRNHPILQLDNLVITPHLGSATEQTRQRMAEISVENLFRGLGGKPLLHQVRP